MLVVDISEVIYSGMSYMGKLFLPKNDIVLKGIPYCFSKIANYALKNSNLVFAFDPEPTKSKYVGKYQTKRLRQPRVLWELRILKDLLDLIEVPVMQLNGCNADSLIFSALEDNEGMEENHYIVAVDRDIACNVKIRYNGFENIMLGFNTKGYNANPSNFKDIYNVPYNFMNIHKLCTGCPSDAIPVGSYGKQLEFLLYEYLEAIIEIESDYRYHNISDLNKVRSVFSCNTREFFFNWLRQMNRLDLIKEYEERADAIFPKRVNVGDIPPTDWGLLNGLIFYMFGDTKLTYNQVLPSPLSKELKSKIDEIVLSTKLIDSNVFIPTNESELGLVSLDDLSIFTDGRLDV